MNQPDLPQALKDVPQALKDVTATLTDAAYVTVGFGVLAVQKAQVRRRELEKHIESQSSQWREQLAGMTNGVKALLGS